MRCKAYMKIIRMSCFWFAGSSPSGGCANSPDRITVRDGADQSPSSPVLAQFCGTSNGQTVTSSAEHLHIELITDAVNQRQGFAAEFSFLAADTGGVFAAPDGSAGSRPLSDVDIGSTTLSIGVDVSGAFQTPTQPSEPVDDASDNSNNGNKTHTHYCVNI